MAINDNIKHKRTLKTEYRTGQQNSYGVYTVAEIMIILGISRNSAYRLVKKRCFVSKRIGTDIRISKASFDDWLNSDDCTGVEERINS